MAYENSTGYPSVSDILAVYVDKQWFTDEPKIRGEIVHAAAASYLLGLFSPPVDPEYQGYVDSMKRWIDDCVVEVVLVEKRLIDERLKYCGKPDLIAVLKGRHSNTMIDFKTGQQELKPFRIQNAAYRNLAKENGIMIQSGMTVRLKPDGSGAIIAEYQSNYQKEFNIFIGILNSYKYFLL